MKWSFLLALVFMGGCALTSKSKPLDVHWYTPEQVHSSSASRGAAPGPPLRIGRVMGGMDLTDRIIYGDGVHEVGYYESRRWTKRPEEYVRSALDHALLEDGPFERVIDGAAPTLDVEVLSFQEVRTPHTHVARVVLHLLVTTDRVLFEDTLLVDEPVVGPQFDDFVAAMARALDVASVEVARRVAGAVTVQ